eukprot:SAG11_NODE_30726_length_298_cov_0.778894_1_plen_72_part_10
MLCIVQLYDKIFTHAIYKLIKLDFRGCGRRHLRSCCPRRSCCRSCSPGPALAPRRAQPLRLQLGARARTQRT